MRYIFRIIKRIFFWSYARNTWQYDVLCALILAFIFLTPQSWYKNSELGSNQPHQSRSASIYLLAGPELANEMERGEIERRVRAATGRPETEVTDVRAVRDAGGQTVAYEVDIR
jgi:hypothetical protein